VAIVAGYGLPVRIGFEATSSYHRALAHHMPRAGFDLKLVSSVALARTGISSCISITALGDWADQASQDYAFRSAASTCRCRSPCTCP
jgi:hypothetical protein